MMNCTSGFLHSQRGTATCSSSLVRELVGYFGSGGKAAEKCTTPSTTCAEAPGKTCTGSQGAETAKGTAATFKNGSSARPKTKHPLHLVVNPCRPLALSVMILVLSFTATVAGPNYGVYFEKDGPYPNGDKTPVSNSRKKDAKPPSKWHRVTKKMYPYDWAGYFDHLELTNIHSFLRHNRNMCEDRALSNCEGLEGDPTKCNYDDWHKQSPIQVQYDPRLLEQCDDRHPFQTPVDGTCSEEEILFKVTPTGLRADLNCQERPILDFSRNDHPWNMRAIEIKVPGEHEHRLDNGTVLTYGAEIHLIHTGTGAHDDDFGIVAIWLDGSSSNVKNAELEKYLVKWEAALEEQYRACDVTYDEEICDVVDGYTYQTPFNIVSELEQLTFDTFESGTVKHWIGDGSRDSSIAEVHPYMSISDGSHTNKTRVFRVRRSSYMELISVYDVRKYAELVVSFGVYGQNVLHDHMIELLWSSDGGTAFAPIEQWVVGIDLQANSLVHLNTTITRSETVAFTNQVKLRLRVSTGSKTRRRFYFDNIAFLGKISSTSGSSEDNFDVDADAFKEEEVTQHSSDIIEGNMTTVSDEDSDFYFDNNMTLSVNETADMSNSTGPELIVKSNNAVRHRRSLDQLMGINSFNDTSASVGDNNSTTSGTFVCDQNDFFCPYRLFRQTNNPYYHRYYGSLTSPPCTEQVSWKVMIEPLIISKGQLHRLEMLVAKYMEYPRCKPRTWGKPRPVLEATSDVGEAVTQHNNRCKVDVNRPIQYLSGYHELQDCEEFNEFILTGEGKWSIETTPLVTTATMP